MQENERDKFERIARALGEQGEAKQEARSQDEEEVSPNKYQETLAGRTPDVIKRIKMPENYKGIIEVTTTDGNYTLEWTKEGWAVHDPNGKKKTYRNKEDVLVSANKILVIGSQQCGMIIESPESLEAAA